MITNTRLAELRNRGNECLKRATQPVCTSIEKDYADLYQIVLDNLTHLGQDKPKKDHSRFTGKSNGPHLDVLLGR